MIERNIISSGRTTVGSVYVSDDKIVIHTFNKPPVTITDINDINDICCKSDVMIVKLYDYYNLTIAEIAALYDIKYYQARNKILSLDTKSPTKAGRRNSSYNLKFSEDRLKHMSESHKGQPCKTIYERTPEIRKKTSDTLKSGYKSGRVVVNRKAISDAWKRGCYKESKMGTAIQGYMYSIKNKKNMYFRSLLELFYLLIIEKDSNVLTYEVEPISIPISESSVYIPDIMINNNLIVEIKSTDRAKYDERFPLEMKALDTYCKENNLKYNVVYDKDLQYSTKKFKKYLKENPNIIEQFNIRYV